MVCPECGSFRMTRRRRSLVEKLRFAAVYICLDCHHAQPVRVRRRHPFFSLHVCCPRCGTFELRTFSKIDHIESIYNNPISRIQQLFGATLWYCHWCRMQFFDFRKPLH